MLAICAHILITLNILFSFNAVAAVDSPCSLFPTSFLTQTLNHDQNSTDAAAGTGTFTQQYQLNTTYFKPGGPILFFQNSEGAAIRCVEESVLHDWAQQTGAIIAGLEHRFFGLSKPSGFNDTTATPAEYAPLTINNTLLDSVNFIHWIKRTVPGAEDSKAIVLGASYGGTLATLLRLWYPETFFGALASGPLLSTFGPEATNENKYNWWNWTSRVYRLESPEASQKIQKAMSYFNHSLASREFVLIGPAVY